MVAPIYRQGYYMPNALVGPVGPFAPVAPVAPMAPVAGVAPVASVDVVPAYPTCPGYPVYSAYPSYPAVGGYQMVNMAVGADPTVLERRCPSNSYGYNSSPQMNNAMSSPATIINRITNNNTSLNSNTNSNVSRATPGYQTTGVPAIGAGLSPGQKMIRTYNAKRTKVVRFPRSQNQDVVRPALAITNGPTGGGRSAAHGGGLAGRSIHVHVSARAGGRR
ncbi:hypothetical protein IAU59_002124 [Kwoniella sp. CBS 9459]